MPVFYVGAGDPNSSLHLKGKYYTLWKQFFFFKKKCVCLCVCGGGGWGDATVVIIIWI